MHYDGFLGGRIQHPIIIDKLTGKGIQVNKEMSSLDIEKLNQMYPCNKTDPGCGKFLYMSFGPMVDRQPISLILLIKIHV